MCFRFFLCNSESECSLVAALIWQLKVILCHQYWAGMWLDYWSKYLRVLKLWCSAIQMVLKLHCTVKMLCWILMNGVVNDDNKTSTGINAHCLHGEKYVCWFLSTTVACMCHFVWDSWQGMRPGKYCLAVFVLITETKGRKGWMERWDNSSISKTHAGTQIIIMKIFLAPQLQRPSCASQ